MALLRFQTLEIVGYKLLPVIGQKHTVSVFSGFHSFYSMYKMKNKLWSELNDCYAAKLCIMCAPKSREELKKNHSVKNNNFHHLAMSHSFPQFRNV